MELKFDQDMYNPRNRVISTDVDPKQLANLIKSRESIQLRSTHTGQTRMFDWNDKSSCSGLVYYNEDMDVYLYVRG